ncbi:putative glutamine amidotransferase [Fodinibius roseus]|uniref:Putative glutamine amidotransferase n=1 Tax=Fodinibius roseus TaxID=1194090 RepID=A0A1M5K4N2_9BACT|nr:type 1 glutamine amidotransferase [Fodinibius roseus]SHG47223.1 putative glutamine amidotransferase [Fodinibius roseus]
MSKRPNIGVTGPDKGGQAAWWFTWFAIFIHGGRAIRIRPQEGIPDDDIHGLVIGGGADINPTYYRSDEVKDLLSEDQDVSGLRQFFIYLATIFFFPFIYLIRKMFSTSASGVDKERDELEFTILKQALDKGIPILGICRGAQLINIHLGGTLHGDISNYYTEQPQVKTVWPKKKVRLAAESILHRILGHQFVWVNALHNQAVDTLGSDLKIVAREENGVVQAVEHESRDFVLGVQWHPEYMPQIPPQRRIFQKLVGEARIFLSRSK